MSKILVVDDEVGIRELLREALIKNGHGVMTVPSADQAYETMLQQPFDLILLDVKLSGSSGIDVLKKVRELQKEIPVVIYSGVVTPELEKEAKQAGANAVISKDVGIMELIKQMTKFIKIENLTFVGPVSSKEKKILIVDDEAEVRNVLTIFFDKKGYKTQEAENGEQAIEIVRSEDFPVVLLDIDMPVMDGLTTLAKLLEMKPEICVVMVTGRQDEDKVQKALELGAYNYVLKPFEFLYLELIIKSKLDSAESDTSAA